MKSFRCFWACQKFQNQMMRQVLQGICEVLDDDGSIFVHIDERTHAHLRLMLDELFGEGRMTACRGQVERIKRNA